MNVDILKNDSIDKYHAIGQEKFYKSLLCGAISGLTKIKNGDFKGISPEIEFLSCSDKFLFLYRRESDVKYLELSRIYRRAAHKIYRLMLKKGMTKRNDKFLNLA